MSPRILPVFRFFVRCPLRRALRILLGAVILITAGCTESFPLQINGLSVKVYDGTTGRERTLVPGTEPYRAFAEWLKKNQKGWQPYLATPPASGTRIDLADGYRLQFFDDSVLLIGPGGVRCKNVASRDIAFLNESSQ